MHRRSRRYVAGIFFLCAWLALPAVSFAQKMQLHFINVGQGAATLVEFPCAAVLIDTGGETNDQFKSTDELTKYLRNPFTRSREVTQILTSAAPDVDPAEASFEILDRLGAKPDVPRFAFIAGLRSEFSEAAIKEAESAVASPHPVMDTGLAITIDDDDTVEIDD
ncbi:MAG: hypothetical protein HY255_05645, partial [Betaproteobacteria bacterium]|nr:hypothetical protein [Betaproteobacteria bacterium]